MRISSTLDSSSGTTRRTRASTSALYAFFRRLSLDEDEVVLLVFIPLLEVAAEEREREIVVDSSASLLEDAVPEREWLYVVGETSSRLYVSCEDLEKAELSSAVSTLTESTSDSATLLEGRRSGRLSSSSASSASSTYRAATATTPWA
jgi:hypothetical protein